MFWIGDWEIGSWYGCKSEHSSFVSYFNSQGAGENRNLGILILPFRFWNHIGITNEEFGHENKRIWIGLGVLSFFFDYYSPNKEN